VYQVGNKDKINYIEMHGQQNINMVMDFRFPKTDEMSDHQLLNKRPVARNY
jgi:hypothetical protein